MKIIKISQNSNHEEVDQVGKQLEKYGEYMQSLMHFTDDIDDPEIQLKANEIVSQLRIYLDTVDFRKIEDLLLSLDKLQKMWWADGVENNSEFIMPNEFHK